MNRHGTFSCIVLLLCPLIALLSNRVDAQTGGSYQTHRSATAATLTAFGTVRCAVIGDYGSGLQPELDVSTLVTGWGPDLIITAGD